MSTLVLEVKFIDDTQSVDKEFTDLTALSVWLHGQRESDFDWLCLHDNINDYVFEGWSDIVQYITENTGPVLSTHDLSQCGDACNCMKCNPSKSSCIALRASELNIEAIDQPALDTLEPEDLNGIPVRVGDSLEFQPLPGIIRFHELEDGAEFWLAQTFAYGGRQKLQKTLEDGGPHNAVYVNDHHIGLIIPDDRLVIRA